jgi:hypothetical protein
VEDISQEVKNNLEETMKLKILEILTKKLSHSLISIHFKEKKLKILAISKK